MASSTVFRGNPYVIGVPIDDRKSFFGRESLFAYVRDNLITGAKVILLSGQRRIGKSSVLRQIPNFVELPDFAFVYYDLQASTRVSLGQLLYSIGEEIVRHVERHPALKLPSVQELEADPGLFVTWFLIQVYVSIRGKKLVLLLDEFDVLDQETGQYAAGSFFPYIQGVIDKDPSLYVIPVVGRRLDQISQLPGRFLSAPHQEIKLLDERSARRLITKPVEGVLEFAPGAVEAVIDLTSGHPYFTQLLCFSVFQRAREEEEWTVTRPHVESVVPDAIISGQGGLTWFREGLPIPERVVFSAIADLQQEKTVERLNSRRRLRKPAGGVVMDLLETYGVTPDSLLLNAENSLLDWDFIKEAGEGAPPGLHSRIVTVELVRRWLVQQYPLRREIFELEKLADEARSAYESATEARRRGDLSLAINFCRHALEINPNHLHALGELGELYLEDDDYGPAVEAYARAFLADAGQHKEGFVLALLGHARDLIRQGDYGAAKDELSRVLEIAPGNTKALSRLAEAEAGIRRALAVQNPFFVGDGVPTDRFVGRQKEVVRLLDSLVNRGNVALYGERGMGKTSLLQYVASPDVLKAHGVDPERTILIYVNCPSLVPFSPERLWDRVLQELERRLPSDSRRPRPRIEGNVGSLDTWAFFYLIHQLVGASCACVLLLDEFEVALQPNQAYSEEEVLSFLHTLRAVMTERVLSFLVATRRRLVELGPDSLRKEGSPWFNAFVFAPLLPFTEAEISQLAARMPTAVGALSDNERTWLRVISGGYPFLVQSALSLLFHYHASEERFEQKKAMQELASAVEQPFSALWQGLSPAEQDVLTLIAIGNVEWRISGDVRIEELLGLESRFYAREVETLSRERGLLSGREPAHPEIASSLFEWWILRKFELQENREIDQFLERLTTRFPRLEVDRLSDVVRKVWGGKAALADPSPWGRPLSGVA